MKTKKKRKVRTYRLNDLVDMAMILGCRIKLDMIPLELLNPPKPPETKKPPK